LFLLYVFNTLRGVKLDDHLAEKCLMISVVVSIQLHDCDRQTDGHRPTASTVLLRIASRGKKSHFRHPSKAILLTALKPCK